MAQWMEHKYQYSIPLSMMVIYPETETLFDEMNATDPDLKVPSFAASARWFLRFRKLQEFHNL
jgi:hypothetical protein